MTEIDAIKKGECAIVPFPLLHFKPVDLTDGTLIAEMLVKTDSHH